MHTCPILSHFLSTHFRPFPKFNAAPAITRPSPINSRQLFQMFSFALDKNLKDYHRKNIIQRNNQVKAVTKTHNQLKKPETIIIDLESDEEIVQEIKNDPKGPQQIAVVYNNKEQINEAMNEQHIQKSQLSPVKQPQFITQTFLEIYKQDHQKQNNGTQLNKVSISIEKNYTSFHDYRKPTVQCPKLGLSNLELLSKKQNLMLRKIDVWSDFLVKGLKQRREVRMLKN